MALPNFTDILLSGNHRIYRSAMCSARFPDGRWRYISSEDQLRGLQIGRVLIHDTFWRREDARQIWDMVNMLIARRRLWQDEVLNAMHDRLVIPTITEQFKRSRIEGRFKYVA